MPEGAFEAAFAIYLIVKGFRPSPILDDARYAGGDGGSLRIERVGRPVSSSATARLEGGDDPAVSLHPHVPRESAGRDAMRTHGMGRFLSLSGRRQEQRARGCCHATAP